MATIVNDKQILLKESNIEFYREDKCIGSGDLEITSKNIIWTNNNNNNNDNGTEAYETNIYFKFDFCDAASFISRWGFNCFLGWRRFPFRVSTA